MIFDDMHMLYVYSNLYYNVISVEKCKYSTVLYCKLGRKNSLCLSTVQYVSPIPCFNLFLSSCPSSCLSSSSSPSPSLLPQLLKASALQAIDVNLLFLHNGFMDH